MQTTRFDFDAIGTHWQIDIIDNIHPQMRSTLLEKIISLIEAFDKTYSRFRSDSLITTMSKKKGSYRLPDNAFSLMTLYKELYELTDHAFTPLIGQVLVDAGYDASYSLQPGVLQRPPDWDNVMEYSHPTLVIKQPVLLDIGAGGKGYLIDLVSSLLQTNQIYNFCVEAGGDMVYQTSSQKKLRVGLEHPDDPSQVIDVATILNQSICGSAGNRRKWGKFHHIINPHTLTSPQHLKATWVVAKTGLLADALSTCLFFVAPEKLKRFDFSYAIIYQDNSLAMSRSFPAKMFTVPSIEGK